MRNQVNFKSILIGFFSAALLIAAFSFKQNSTDNEGHYQTAVGETGVVILDTKTGEYIINTDGTNRGWRKGDFSNTHRIGKDNY